MRSSFLSSREEAPWFSRENQGASSLLTLLLLCSGFAFTLATKVDTAGINEHAQSLQLFFSWWVHLPGLARIKRPTGVAHHVFHTDTRVDHVEFENASLGIAPHDA